MVKEHQVLHACHLAELDADHVARMAPVFLDRDRLGERVHGVEDDEIRVAKEGDDRLGLRAVLELVLRVGGVDDALAADLEAIAIGVARVALQLRRHLHAADFERVSTREAQERDVGVELLERHREAGRRLLQAKRLLEDVMAAVDADLRAAPVSGTEEGKPHDVVPVRVRHEHVDGRRASALARHDVIAEGARAATHVADEVLVRSQVELDARGVAAVGMAEREGQLGAGEGIGLAIGGEAPAGSGDQRLRQLVADVGRGQADRDGAARTPEAYAHRALSPGRRPAPPAATPRRAPRVSCRTPAAPG